MKHSCLSDNAQRNRPYRMTNSRKTTGFTLIELLVVIAIISILAAILFPTFSRAREKGRQTACLSNNRQLNMAIMQYEQDYDETLPNATDGSISAGRIGGWIYFSSFPANQIAKSYDVTKGSIYSYVKNAQIFSCPSDSQGRASGNSYAANSCVFTGQALGFETGKLLAAFDSPATFMMYGEEAENGNTFNSSTDDGYMLYQANSFSTRHTEGCTLSFVDGHTKWYRPDQIAASAFQTGGVKLAQCP